MLRTHKFQIYSFVLLFFAFSFSGFGQSESINFLWNDQENNERNASLALNWNHNENLNHWELHITVKWLDTNGEIITNSKNQPFLFLSEYDYEVKSEVDISCVNFDVSKQIFDMQFQDKGVLRFIIPPDIESPGTVLIKFGYALSEADIENAIIDPIKIPGQDMLIATFPDTRVPEDDVVENVTKDPVIEKTKVLSPETKAKCLSIREDLAGLVKLRNNYSLQLVEVDREIIVVRTDIDKVGPGDSLKQVKLEHELQSHFEVANVQIAGIDSSLVLIRGIRENIDVQNLPQDSAEQYKDELNRLENRISSLRGEYVDTRIQIRRMLGELGSSYADNQLTAMKNSIEKKFGELFNAHIDSLERINDDYSTLEKELDVEITKGPKKASKSETFQELRDLHDAFKARLDSVKVDHRATYFAYRKDIEETDQIPSIETLNLRFNDLYGNVDELMNNMDLKISRLIASMNEQKSIPTPMGIVIGAGLLLLFTLVIVIVVLSRRRKQNSGRLLIPSDNGEFNILDDPMEESVDYFKMKLPSDQQDIMVSEVHFHIRVIKSIYHLVQGALLDKKPENFGGLMFGRHYRANGNGNEKNIVIIERVVEASKIRRDMTVGLDSGALLVEEIDKLVEENKKLALLGWFTSSADSDNEMPDNMVKVHRTYFSEKWQIASLIYPGSDQMNSGIFIRRKSGYFEASPSDDFSLSWDELYQFAVDPPARKEMEEKKRPVSSEYVKINLNHNWCDSIVEHLYIHPDVLNEISSEKENRMQMVAGQKASGFLYGEVWNLADNEGDGLKVEYEIYINKYTVATSSENPRELPGSELLGWIRADDDEIFEILKMAVPYHEDVFKAPFQICALLNNNTSEIRFFSRKHNLEMNNNTIETEEFNLNTLLS